jgi:hypothetical protein
MSPIRRFNNSPRFNNEGGEQKVKRYVHSPLTVEHNGIQASIKANGKVVISGEPRHVQDSDEMEYDEIEIPASLIFKLANLLRDTRQVKYVNLSELKDSVPEPAA